MRKDIAVVETGHGNLGNDHLQEGRESRKDTRLSFLKTKSGGGGEVTAFHDPGCNEHLGVLLVNDLETSRSLEITFV